MCSHSFSFVNVRLRTGFLSFVFINIIVLVFDKNTQFLLFFFKEKEKVRRKKVYTKNIKFEKG